MKQGENALVIYDERGNSPQEVRVNLEADASRHRMAAIAATRN
jgi:hypothetical protein